MGRPAPTAARSGAMRTPALRQRSAAAPSRRAIQPAPQPRPAHQPPPHPLPLAGGDGSGGGGDLAESLLQPGDAEPSDAPELERAPPAAARQQQHSALIVHRPFDLDAFLRYVWERWTALLRECRYTHLKLGICTPVSSQLGRCLRRTAAY